MTGGDNTGDDGTVSSGQTGSGGGTVTSSQTGSGDGAARTGRPGGSGSVWECNCMCASELVSCR